MKKGKIITGSTIIAIISIATIIISQIAVNANNMEKQISQSQSGFFTTDKTEVKSGGYITMTIDLSKVDYENFKFTLTADSTLEGSVLEDTKSEDTNKLTTNADNNTITVIGKKSELTATTITLYYKVSEKITVGSTITLTAKIESLDANDTTNESTNTTISTKSNTQTEDIENNKNENTNNVASSENSQNQENNKLSQNLATNETDDSVGNSITNSTNNLNQNSTTNSTTNNTTNENNYKSAVVKITVVEKESNNASNQNTLTNNTQSNGQDGMNNINTNNMETIKNSGTTSTTQSANGLIASTTAQTSTAKSSTSTSTAETYKGSYINYLTDITVNGYSLKPDFTMTNTTYVLTVENSVTSLDIDVTKYDSSSTVKIYGNTDLSVGQNKVLISVTAENGSVRTYRIYVTRQGA